MSTAPRLQTALPRSPAVGHTGGLVEAGPAFRTRATARWAAARGVVVLGVGYLALLPWSSASQAAVQAVIATVVWLAVGRWTAQTYRSMTFVFGAFAIAAVTSLVGAAAMAALCFWIPKLGIPPNSLLALTAAMLVGLGTWDFVAERTSPTARRVLVVGGGTPTARLLDDLARDPGTSLEVVGIVDDSLTAMIGDRVPWRGRLTELPAIVRQLSPDLVVVAVPTGRPEVFAQLLGVADAGFRVVGLPEIYEFAFGRLPVEDLTSAWFMSVLHAYNRPTNRVAKRAFDILVALVGLILILPLLPAIALLVKRTPGPFLYRQQRLGEYGRSFTILKFRSMRVDAETSSSGAQWAIENDPRVTAAGRILRALRLDELPQLWNVLRGDMAIVGPRPERPEFGELLDEEVPFWSHRHLLKPGVTGWAQIRAGYASDALGTVEKLSYDLWYLRHRSLMLDLMICAKTLPRMILSQGAH